MAEKDWIARYFAPLSPDGLNDDVASLAVPGPLVITSDSVVESVHFLASDPIGTVARKLVRRNVSDIHAKGARPCEALLTLGWPPDRPETELSAFAAALGADLDFWGVRLIGGDTTASPQGLFASITMTGHCVARGEPVRRAGARPGDRVWVTGEIGAACIGFDVLKLGCSDAPEASRYRVPELPPYAAAVMVGSHATASIDISDGLFADALALSKASGVTVRIDLGLVPFADPKPDHERRIQLAGWGDDYQILFTAGAEQRAAIGSASASGHFRVTEIGRVTTGSGIEVLSESKLINLPETLGFEHGRIGRSGIRP